jgi:restriction system protein
MADAANVTACRDHRHPPGSARLDRIYVQAKCYAADRPVGRQEIQEFVGDLHGAQADRGVFIATSRFTPDATDYAERVAAGLVLIDGRMLARLMVDLNIGV